MQTEGTIVVRFSYWKQILKLPRHSSTTTRTRVND